MNRIPKTMKEGTNGETAGITDHARLVLERRYLRRNPQGEVTETPTLMFKRVAETVAGADVAYDSEHRVSELTAEFYEMMVGLDFLPNSPTLMNAGRELGQLSACFVLPVGDSIESIFNAIRDTALIHKSGGGTGFSFSSIRPANDLVKSTLGVSSGPISFMNVFDVATETIKQGGVRRGANMGLLSVHHPDILEFISVKAEHPGRFSNFNLSVSITDKFMAAVREGTTYELINPHTLEVQARPWAREVMDAMIRAAWACGDPGIVFIDRINETNPLPHLGSIEATNPCGEQPLLPYESCTLGSINLSRFIRAEKMDYERLQKVVRLAVHFLDNVIDVNRYPLPQIEALTIQNRKIGLGVMGLADALILMKIPYHSTEALDFCGGLMKVIQKAAREASGDLARHRGNFPNYQGSVYYAAGLPMRNATTTTIAPTGTLSLIAGCSSGIEPLFALAYRRRILDGQDIVEVHPLFRKILSAEGYWTEELATGLAKNGTLGMVDGIPGRIRRLFVTAHELEPIHHLQVQAAFQSHTDNAVSKTINLPREASLDVVRQIFMTAFDLGLKGVTVYRDGSKTNQVISPGGSRPGEGTWSGIVPGMDGPCPECGDTMSADRGCWLCPSCGYSRCL